MNIKRSGFHPAAQRFFAEVAERPPIRENYAIELAVAEWLSGAITADHWWNTHEENLIPWASDGFTRYWLNLPVASWQWDRDWIFTDDTLLGWDSHERFTKMLNDGLPIPMARIAEVDHIPWVLQDETIDQDLDAFTAQRFSIVLDRWRAWDSSFTLEPGMRDWVTAVSKEANQILTSLLQDGPELRLTLARPHQWLTSSPLVWTSPAALPLLNISVTGVQRSCGWGPVGGCLVRWCG